MHSYKELDENKRNEQAKLDIVDPRFPQSKKVGIVKYTEHENLIYRRESEAPGFPMSEFLSGGKWVPATDGKSQVDAALFGMPMTEEEAKEFAGDDWPAGGDTDPGK